MQQTPPAPGTTPGNALYGSCVRYARRSDRVYVMWLKSPGSLHSFPYSTEREETQRICLHSRNARINWEGCMSVGAQSSRQLLFYRKSVRGRTFPFRALWLRGEKTGGPRLPGGVGPAPRPRGGPAAAGRPTLRTRGGRRPGRGAARGLGSALGAGLPPAARAGGSGKEGRARYSSKNAHQNFCFFLPPHFLKAKAIIYRPFRCAECSLFELDIQTPPKGAGGAGAEKRRAAAGEAGRARGAPVRSRDAGRAPLF